MQLPSPLGQSPHFDTETQPNLVPRDESREILDLRSRMSRIETALFAIGIHLNIAPVLAELSHGEDGK